ncbi:alpha-glucuronidase family glycosyl hydrolase [Shouchella tritolerans]|uniref:alpha-glucuronidase family glycosyl hydrolase n=1 Tax=Shouchella tritolerans TaxID=2979466 RepID=UPI0021E74481|nr:alpha-glucuronidase family glycosyl hydrolase [Shouchella tritolerans]
MITLVYPDQSPKIQFAISKLKKTLTELDQIWTVALKQDVDTHNIIVKNRKGHTRNGVSVKPSLSSEGFQIRHSVLEGKSTFYILSGDDSGAMYGIFELCEQLQNRGLSNICECTMNPRFSFRALKFNLPWSSYRKNHSFDIQKETVRDLTFWRSYLDMMAENRFNVLTLWSMHPFPYMIKPKNFPKATPYTDEELADWKHFWTSLFQMAKDRGIETYLVTWNIFVSESFREHYDPNSISDEEFYHHGDGYSTDPIKQYNRECVTQLINEYPDLTGLSTSLGERMNGLSPKERQKWIEDVYYQGMKDANRPVKYIYRAPFTIDPSITREAIEKNDFLPEPVWLELKFNWSHAYSTPKLRITHGGRSDKLTEYWNPDPKNYKVAWMARNEDFFTLRWAQPDFIREHIKENGHDYVGGYFIGSECFIPAYDYSHSRESDHFQWSYAFEKHWLYYMLWGRLLFDPSTPDEVFAQELGRRYGQSNGRPLLEAYSAVSKMPLALASSFLTLWDFTLYAEGFLSTDTSGYNSGKAFISLEDLLNTKPIESTYLSIRDYVNRKMNQESTEGWVTPIQLAETLEKDSQHSLELLASIADHDSPVLCCEKADIKAWAYLGFYFADKLRAGVCYQMYLETGDESERQKALQWLESPHAIKHWDDLIEVTSSHYGEQPLMHLGNTPFSWKLFRPQVLGDIDFVRGEKKEASQNQ